MSMDFLKVDDMTCAMQRQIQNRQAQASSSAFIVSGVKYILLVVLSGSSRGITTLSLSPVYGFNNIFNPIGNFVEAGFLALMIAGHYRSKKFEDKTAGSRLRSLLNNVSLLLYLLQASYLSQTMRWSSVLGPFYGPIIAQVPVNALTAYVIAQPWIGSFGEFGLAMGHGITFIIVLLGSIAAPPSVFAVENFTRSAVSSWQHEYSVYAPWAMLLMISILYCFWCTKNRLVQAVAAASFVFTLVSNQTMFSLSRLNARLEEDGFRVLERRQSITGYISIVENTKMGYQALRCDHSLLGGEWTRYPAQLSLRLREPIYAVFVTLEAVRLAETNGPKKEKPTTEQQALMIGLGVGTSATAFVYHGISTTVVEIDPVVHDFATKYFNLPTNHTKVIGDALHFVHDHQDDHRGKYDYIIHDVFTGGAEPLELFTVRFITQLAGLLQEDGTVAINYAGDLLQPSAAAVVKTALSVFPSCRLFRETAAPSTPTNQDMANMIIFCRKTSASFTFRQPVEADFLGSQARKEHLVPRFEVPASRFRSGELITSSTATKLKASQRRNARNHWYSMRESIPAKVWENF